MVTLVGAVPFSNFPEGKARYSAPKDGAEAILTNTYLMLGAELGIPALLCLVVALRNGFRKQTNNRVLIACRASAIALLVMFWFNGGLFELPTACIFWILLELGNPPATKFASSRIIKSEAVAADRKPVT